MFDNDDEIEAVWKKQHALSEFTAPTNFKSYDELKTRLDMVLAGTTKVGSAAEIMESAPVASPSCTLYSGLFGDCPGLSSFSVLFPVVSLPPNGVIAEKNATSNFISKFSTFKLYDHRRKCNVTNKYALP